MNDLWMAPAGCEKKENCYFRAVRIIEDEKPATIEIAAESYYILYINGKIVGRGPARGTRQQNYFDTFEVSEYLVPGRNVVAVLVYCMNISTFTATPSQPALWIRFDGQAQSPEDWRVAIAPDWLKETPIYTKQTGFSECRDFRLEPAGLILGEGTENWSTAIAVPADRAIYSKKLLPRDIPSLKETVILPEDILLKASVARVHNLDINETAKLLTEEKHLVLSPERLEGFSEWIANERENMILHPTTDGKGIVLLFDFGTEVIGRFELAIEGVDGAIVDLCHEEELWNGRLKAAHPVNSSIKDGYNFSDRYFLRKGRQIVGNTINERGFRMVQAVFRNFDEPLVIHSVRAVKSVYPYPHRGTFSCDDFMLNRIWEVCGETLSVCTTDIFTDCPWRERAFWVNDLIVENKTSLEFFGASVIHRRAFRLAFSEARDNGLVPCVCPCRDDSIIFPATNLFMPLMLHDYLLYSGDISLIKELLPHVFRIFDTFEAWFDDDSLIVPPENLWNFFDWSYGLTGISLNGKNTSLLNYLYVMATGAATELAAYAGITADEKYRYRAIKTAEAANRRFFKETENRLADWLEPDGNLSGHSSQLAHALALLSGKVPFERHKAFVSALDDDKILEPELYLSFFVFQAMRLCGQETAALERIRKYWGPIVESGSPTIWEMGVHKKGKAAFGGNGSLCHGFATAPVDFFQTVILGVKPLKPGFAEFRLSPNPCGLKFAQGRIPTPSGNIRVRWEDRENKLMLNLDVPPGIRAVCDDGRIFNPGKHELLILSIPNLSRLAG